MKITKGQLRKIIREEAQKIAEASPEDAQFNELVEDFVAFVQKFDVGLAHSKHPQAKQIRSALRPHFQHIFDIINKTAYDYYGFGKR